MPNRRKLLTLKDLTEVELMAGLGMRFEDIARAKDVCMDTLKKYADDYLQRGKAVARAQVMQSAFKMATSGKHPAMTMFWLKTQCGWRETAPIEATHPGPQDPTVAQVTVQLAHALQLLEAGKLDPKLAQSMATLANSLLKGLQLGQLENRLGMLEALLPEAQRGRREETRLEDG